MSMRGGGGGRFGGALLVLQGGAVVGGLLSGNARGSGALDLQSFRTADTQVASGLLALAVGSRVTAAAANAVAVGNNVTLAASDGSQVALGNTIVTNGGGDVLVGKNITANNNGMAGGSSDNVLAGFSVRADFAVDCLISGAFVDVRGVDATDSFASCLILGENIDWDLAAGGYMVSSAIIGTNIIPAAPTATPLTAAFVAGADFDPTPYMGEVSFGGFILAADYGAGGGVFLVGNAQARSFAVNGLTTLIRGTLAQSQGAPAAKTTAVTLTIAELLAKIVTGTHSAGGTQAYTLPTGTNADAGVTFAIDDSFEWSLINLSAAAADTITLTASSGHTIVGNPIVQSAHATTGGIYGNSARWRTRKTAANTFVTYRIS